MNENDGLYIALKCLAELRQVKLGDMILGFYIEELKNVPIEKIETAVKYFATKGDRHFPSIDEFKRACGIEVINALGINEKAQKIVNDMRYCIKKFGYMRTDEAKKYLGNDAWEVLERFGGYVNICNTATDYNFDDMMIQLRKTAEVHIKLAAGGMQNDHLRFIEQAGLKKVTDYLASAEDDN